MTYLVEFATRAVRDLETLYIEKNVAESHAAADWYNGLERAVHSLQAFPHRGALARERQAARRTLRQLLYGAKPYIYRMSTKSMKGAAR
jgi:plasmid stabilization system protein ParE